MCSWSTAFCGPALQRGVDWGWLPTNPAVRARPPKVVKTDTVALTPEQVAALYEAADEPAVKVTIGLAAVTGMRRGEVLGLKWSDIDPETGLVTIERAWVSLETVAWGRSKNCCSDRSASIA